MLEGRLQWSSEACIRLADWLGDEGMITKHTERGVGMQICSYEMCSVLMHTHGRH